MAKHNPGRNYVLMPEDEVRALREVHKVAQAYVDAVHEAERVCGDDQTSDLALRHKNMIGLMALNLESIVTTVPLPLFSIERGGKS